MQKYRDAMQSCDSQWTTCCTSVITQFAPSGPQGCPVCGTVMVYKMMLADPDAGGYRQCDYPTTFQAAVFQICPTSEPLAIHSPFPHTQPAGTQFMLHQNQPVKVQKGTMAAKPDRSHWHQGLSGLAFSSAGCHAVLNPRVHFQTHTFFMKVCISYRQCPHQW